RQLSDVDCDATECRAARRRHRVHGAKPPRVGGDGGGCGDERLRGLSDEGYALRQYEVRAENLAHPREHGIPRVGLPRDQAGGSRGTTEDPAPGEIPFPPRPPPPPPLT